MIGGACKSKERKLSIFFKLLDVFNMWQFPLERTAVLPVKSLQVRVLVGLILLSQTRDAHQIIRASSLIFLSGF